MAIKTRRELKNFFRTNSIPTQEQFADLIDSMLNQSDDRINAQAGNPITITDTQGRTLLAIDQPNGRISIGSRIPVQDGENEPPLVIDSGIKLRKGIVIPQGDWIAAKLGDDWEEVSGFNPAGYFKDTQGIVHLRGSVTNRTMVEAGTTMVEAGTAGSKIFTLDDGYRPSNQELHFVISGAVNKQGVVGRVSIYAAHDGAVKLLSGDAAFVSLDGITFRADDTE